MDHRPSPENGISASVRAYIAKRLKEGAAIPTLRHATVATFVDIFEEESPDKSLVDQYRREITIMVDAAIRSYGPESD